MCASIPMAAEPTAYCLSALATCASSCDWPTSRVSGSAKSDVLPFFGLRMRLCTAFLLGDMLCVATVATAATPGKTPHERFQRPQRRTIISPHVSQEHQRTPQSRHNDQTYHSMHHLG